MKNINEEIKRIMSLFNDDRLYGNLINEATNPDTDGDKKIDSSEFAASGDEIDGDEAKEFLKSLGYKKIAKDFSSVDSVADMCMKSPKIRTILQKSETYLASQFDRLSPNINADKGICYLRLQHPGHADYKIRKTALWNDGRITFYLTLKQEIDFSSQAALELSMPNLSTTSTLYMSVTALGKFLTTKKINYLRYFADLDVAAWTYKNIEFAGFYDENLKRTAKPIENTIIDDFTYNPDGHGDVDISQILTNGSYGNISLNGSVNDLLDKMI